MEPFQPGELVALTEAAVDTRGRIVQVDDAARTVTVHWEVYPGHEHEDTTLDAGLVRRVHESEEGMATA